MALNQNVEDGGLRVTTTQPAPEVIPNVNVYQQKKTLAQGMMDLALLSANANQLRLLVQVGVGIGLIMNSRYDVTDKKEICKANKINDYITIGIFVITLVNVMISAFGVAPKPA
ncbi:ninjurin-A isoform X2 [Anopheles cruzii]|uniref:ninjurin-A isoform X2 n=1 Tax=Anopheles cruzii TaxID=68878 RepID=UPI0022EC40D1|nr:ninjurin-A isoform X2 [Anopheles cruzii]